MKTIRQLIRQPLKTLLGIVLMTLAAAILCLCVGQALAAKTTEEELNRQFCAVGIPKVLEDVNGWVQTSSFFLEDDFLSWLEEAAVQHPDLVKQLAHHGISSAYIPELTPYNPTSSYYEAPVVNSKTWDYVYESFQAAPFNMPYSSAMLVITLEEISQPSELWTQVFCDPVLLTWEDFATQEEYNEYYSSLEYITKQTGYDVELIGTVTEVVALQEGYRCSAGRTARLTLQVPSLEALEALNLVSGEQYVVYGMDFVDEHGKLVDWIEGCGCLPRGTMEPYNPELLEVCEDSDYIAATYAGWKLTYDQYAQLNTITMTLRSANSLLQYEEVRDESGYLQDLVEKSQYTLTDASGEMVTLSKEEYAQRYQVPTITRLDGSVEDFLNSAQGALWKTAAENTRFNSHAFLVVGVDSMDYVGDFSLKRSQIVEGRDFTVEELENGEKVCLIHELMALNAGLQIGDTITLSLYNTDNSLPYQSFREDGMGMINPTASFYFGTTPFTQTAEYTIVGFYRSEKWPDLKENPYSYSANTVFVPKSSVHSPMEVCSSIIFNTLVLHNGKIEAFHELAARAGYAGRFKYNDQDYGTIAANFHNYEALAREMLTVGVALYGVLLLMFLLLYPGSQKKKVRTMHALGAGFIRRFGHILASSLSIVIPASALGGWLGNQLWDRLVAELQTSAESAVALQIEPGTLTAVAGAQLVFALGLTVCTALFAAAPKRIWRRR